MLVKDLREINECRFKGKSGVAVARVQSAEYGKTVAGMLDVSVACNVAEFRYGGLNDINNAWSVVVHATEKDLTPLQLEPSKITVRPSAGDSLFVFVENLDPQSPGFKAFRENMISFASNFGGDIVGKATACITSNGGGGVISALRAKTGMRHLDIRCVPGTAFDDQGNVDPRAFWRCPPHIALLWSNPTLGDVIQGVLDYIRQYGVPNSKRYVTTAVRREMPRRQFMLTGGRSRLENVGLDMVRDDLLMLAEFALG